MGDGVGTSSKKFFSHLQLGSWRHRGGQWPHYLQHLMKKETNKWHVFWFLFCFNAKETPLVYILSSQIIVDIFHAVNWLFLCGCKQDMALKRLNYSPAGHGSWPGVKEFGGTSKWNVFGCSNSYHWLNGCCLRSEWRHSVNVWPVHSRQSRVREPVQLPSWWCWDLSAVWKPPLCGWSSSALHTRCGTQPLDLAAGSASLSKKKQKKNTHQNMFTVSSLLVTIDKESTWPWVVLKKAPGVVFFFWLYCSPSHCSDSKCSWQHWGPDWVMRVSPKAGVAALCLILPCQVICTPQSMFVFVRRSGPASGDRLSLSSSACSHVSFLWINNKISVTFPFDTDLGTLGTQNLGGKVDILSFCGWICSPKVTLQERHKPVFISTHISAA